MKDERKLFRPFEREHARGTLIFEVKIMRILRSNFFV